MCICVWIEQFGVLFVSNNCTSIEWANWECHAFCSFHLPTELKAIYESQQRFTWNRHTRARTHMDWIKGITNCVSKKRQNRKNERKREREKKKCGAHSTGTFLFIGFHAYHRCTYASPRSDYTDHFLSEFTGNNRLLEVLSREFRLQYLTLRARALKSIPSIHCGKLTIWQIWCVIRTIICTTGMCVI